MLGNKKILNSEQQGQTKRFHRSLSTATILSFYYDGQHALKLLEKTKLFYEARFRFELSCIYRDVWLKSQQGRNMLIGCSAAGEPAPTPYQLPF